MRGGGGEVFKSLFQIICNQLMANVKLFGIYFHLHFFFKFEDISQRRYSQLLQKLLIQLPYKYGVDFFSCIEFSSRIDNFKQNNQNSIEQISAVA